MSRKPIIVGDAWRINQKAVSKSAMNVERNDVKIVPSAPPMGIFVAKGVKMTTNERIEKLAQKAARTGSRQDLLEYLEERKKAENGVERKWLN